MKQSRLTAEQIVRIMQEALARDGREGGIREVCRKHGITETTLRSVAPPVRRDAGERGEAAEGT